MFSFPNLEPVPCSCLVLTVTFCPEYRFLRRQIKWSDILISLRIFQFVVIHTVKGFSAVNEANVDEFWNSLAFSEIQWTLAIWSLVPLHCLKLGFTCVSSRFIYCWSLIKGFEYYLASMWYECNYTFLNILWHCLSLGLEWKLTFSSSVAIVEFSKFAGILSAAL